MNDIAAVATRRFGHFLVDRDLVPQTALVRALGIQQTRQTPLGQLAIQHGFLDVAQVFEILGAEAEEPQKLFGEIARELGHLTSGQIERLIELQKASRPPVGEILVELGILDADDLEALLEEFHATSAS